MAEESTRLIGRSWLGELGYRNVCAHPMREEVDRWWGWYTATGDFFESSDRIGKRTFKVKRISIKPAKMACEDWAGLLFNERTAIGIDDTQDGAGSLAAAAKWLGQWLAESGFMRLANRTVERAMALGTAAWALRFDGIIPDAVASPAARIGIERYDARHIVPLAYEGDECTECLLRSKAVVDGKEAHQLRVHRLGANGTYWVHTALFNDSGRRIASDGVAEAFDTGCTLPTFALVRPGIDNSYLEAHPFGVSVFDAALGAVEMVDMAVDNLNRDIYLGQKMAFIPSGMLEHDEDGNVVIPRAADQQVFVAFEGDQVVEGRAQGPYEYNPDMRIADNRAAIKTALELLGKRCGFGKDYYTLDERGGGVMRNKTATEVASDQTELMRNIRKHEESMAPAVKGICAAAVECARSVVGLALPPVEGRVAVVFGDSIIEDDAAVRERDRADVAAGLMPGWQYIAKWQALDDAAAKELWADAQAVPAE
jgi:A118 family predicted phage portal protein